MGFIEKIIRKTFYGKKVLQPFFKTLNNISFKGMNYSNDGTIYDVFKRTVLVAGAFMRI